MSDDRSATRWDMLPGRARRSRSGMMILLAASMCVHPALAVAARSYAIVIGISSYKQYWPSLPNGRPDAEHLAVELKRQGFQIKQFLDGDATRARIDAYVEDELAPSLLPEDRVLFFFSGHGATRKIGNTDFGFVLPYEASRALSTWISMNQIQQYSTWLNNAHHQLFILDSCFGGQLITRGPVFSSHDPTYIDQLQRRRARTVMTAGGKDQLVIDSGFDHTSLFTHELIQALQGLTDHSEGGYITVSDIFTFVLRSASTDNQTPAMGRLPGDEGGEMVFRSPNTMAAASAASPNPNPSVARSEANAPANPVGAPASQPPPLSLSLECSAGFSGPTDTYRPTPLVSQLRSGKRGDLRPLQTAIDYEKQLIAALQTAINRCESMMEHAPDASTAEQQAFLATLATRLGEGVNKAQAGIVNIEAGLNSESSPGTNLVPLQTDLTGLKFQVSKLAAEQKALQMQQQMMRVAP